MMNFDVNLIVFQKIFEIDEIRDLYFSTNEQMRNIKKMQLFSYCEENLALYLGSKIIENSLEHYFLIEKFYFDKVQHIYIQKIPNGFLFPNFIQKKLITQQQLLEEKYKNLSIEKFIQFFKKELYCN